MASAKTAFSLIALVMALAVVGVGGAYLWQVYQGRAVKKDLKAAETALNENRPKDAEQLLVARLDRAKPGAAWVPQALALRFRALQDVNDQHTAAELAKKVLNADRPWAK